MRVGIEVGGTFTDLVAVDGNRLEVIKVPSTPAGPSLEAAGLDPAVVIDLVHGSTDPAKRSAERLREDQADGIISAHRAASWASFRIAAE